MFLLKCVRNYVKSAWDRDFIAKIVRLMAKLWDLTGMGMMHSCDLLMPGINIHRPSIHPSIWQFIIHYRFVNILKRHTCLSTVFINLHQTELNFIWWCMNSWTPNDRLNMELPIHWVFKIPVWHNCTITLNNLVYL